MAAGMSLETGPVKCLVANPTGRATISVMQTTVNASADAEAKAAEDLARARRKRTGLIVKDWRKGIGKLKDTPVAREADELGEQWRRAQTRP